MAKLLLDINHFLNMWEKHGFDVTSLRDIANIDSFFFRLGIDRLSINRIARESLKYEVALSGTASSLLAAHEARKLGFKGRIIFDDFGVWPWKGFASGIWGPLGALFPIWAKTNIKSCYESIDIVLTPSNFQKNKAIKEYGFEPGKIHVAPYPIDSIFSPSVAKGRIRRKLNVGIDEFLVLYAGRLNPTKKVDTLIEATYRSKKDVPIKLLVIGRDQGSKRKLLNLVNQRKLRQDVILMDQVDYEKMPEFYADCDVVATASVYETYCYPIAEAHACGKTVVASNCAAIPEVVGDAGILCSPNSPDSFSEALIRLWQEPSLREELEKKALERSKQANWNVQRTISDIINEL